MLCLILKSNNWVLASVSFFLRAFVCHPTISTGKFGSIYIYLIHDVFVFGRLWYFSAHYRNTRRFALINSQLSEWSELQNLGKKFQMKTLKKRNYTAGHHTLKQGCRNCVRKRKWKREVLHFGFLEPLMLARKLCNIIGLT